MGQVQGSKSGNSLSPLPGSLAHGGSSPMLLCFIDMAGDCAAPAPIHHCGLSERCPPSQLAVQQPMHGRVSARVVVFYEQLGAVRN